VRKAKGLFALLMSIVFLATGCLPGNNNASYESEHEIEAEGDGVQDLEPYELVIAFPIFKHPEDMQLVEEELNKITKAKINTSVKFQNNIAFAYIQQMPLLLTGNQKLDIMISGFGQYTMQVMKDQLHPLNELMDAHGHGVKQTLIDQNPAYLKATYVDGESYGVPNISNLASDYGFIMRKDLAEKYNIDLSAIKTFDDLEAVLEILKVNEPNMTLAKPAETITGMYFERIWDGMGDNLGVVMLNDAGLNVVNGFETMEYKEMVARLHRWYQSGYIAKDAATTTIGGATEVKAGRSYGYLSHMKPGYEMQESMTTGYEMVSSRLLPPASTTAITNSIIWSIVRKSENPERAMMFLNLMYTDPDVINLFNWGIEGKHYVRVEGTENVIHYPPGIDASNSGYQLNMGWMFGNQLLSYVWEGADPEIWAKLSDFNKNAKLSPLMGFSFNSESVKTEIAAVMRVLNQYRVAFETGTISPDKLPEFNAALKAAGLEEIMAEKQKQLDEWKASKS